MDNMLWEIDDATGVVYHRQGPLDRLAVCCMETSQRKYESMVIAAPDMHEALTGLLEQWKEFRASSGNMEEAYYKLAKYARPHWEKAAAALSKANGEGG